MLLITNESSVISAFMMTISPKLDVVYTYWKNIQVSSTPKQKSNSAEIQDTNVEDLVFTLTTAAGSADGAPTTTTFF